MSLSKFNSFNVYLHKGIAGHFDGNSKNNYMYITLHSLCCQNFRGLIRLLNYFFKDNDIDVKLIQEGRHITVRWDGSLYYILSLNDIIRNVEEKQWKLVRLFIEELFDLIDMNFLHTLIENSYVNWFNNSFLNVDSNENGYFVQTEKFDIGGYLRDENEWRNLFTAECPKPCVILGLFMCNKNPMIGRPTG